MPRTYKKQYRRNQRVKKRFTKMDRVRKLAGTQPETTVEKIAKGVGTMATIAKTVAGIVSLINVEDKYVDTDINLSQSTVIQSAIQLNQIAQGSDYNQRNGNKVLDKCLQVNIRILLDPTGTSTHVTRAVLILDKKPQLGALTWNTVYTPPSTTTGMIDKNTAGDRVVVLKDMKFVNDPTNYRTIYKKVYIDMSRLHTQWTGSSASAFETGAIYLLAISDAAGIQPGTIIDGKARFCYTDN